MPDSIPNQVGAVTGRRQGLCSLQVLGLYAVLCLETARQRQGAPRRESLRIDEPFGEQAGEAVQLRLLFLAAVVSQWLLAGTRSTIQRQGINL